MNNKKLTVVDFFCGAGGFSEGFRQMGYDIKYGYDYWKPATDTFNHNFNLNCSSKNMLDFKNSIHEVNQVPNTDIIVGSPPCVSFSNSNKSGKADKSMGVTLTECFLRIVAVKKHQKGSILKAWFMENVVNSKKHLKTVYTFSDLNLTDWANENGFEPTDIAISLAENSTIINSAEYGSIQARKRVISGEIISKGKLVIPPTTHKKKGTKGILPNYKSISIFKNNFPNPFEKESAILIKDVQYSIEIPKDKITDHFYDTGIYFSEWYASKSLKINHPYMGKMSFPENDENPSRTITATKIANSRESIIYKSEIGRTGHGQYRLPTVREAAMIMGFPITYQFMGSEHTKWRLVGNAVCSSVSRIFAAVVLKELRLKQPKKLQLQTEPNLTGVLDLNDYSLKAFDFPPIKNKGSRCRRHPIKDGNMTVTLSNYSIEENSKANGKWMTSIQYGTGDGFPIQNVEDYYYKDLEPIISMQEGGKKFIEIINNGFSEKIGSAVDLQNMYEKQQSFNNLLEPTLLVEEVVRIINEFNLGQKQFAQDGIIVFHNKKIVPAKQLFALYAINKISTTANSK